MSEDLAPKSGDSTTKVDPAGTSNSFCWLGAGTKWRPLVAVLVTFRLSSAVFSQTMYHPDEYWQSLEVAHRMVFGYPLLHVNDIYAHIIQDFELGGGLQC